VRRNEIACVYVLVRVRERDLDGLSTRNKASILPSLYMSTCKCLALVCGKYVEVGKRHDYPGTACLRVCQPGLAFALSRG
jgi:hypothetical protein